MDPVTTNARLIEFAAEEDSNNQPERDPSVVERLLDPISPALGLRLIPGRGDPVYLQNRGTERYLFRDAHERWFILQPSAKESVDDFVRWVYLPEGKPAEIARIAIRQRTVLGYRYVQRSEAPEPVATTVTARYVSEPWPDDVYECGPCGELFDEPQTHAVHCWKEHFWIPNPKQIRRARRK
ncbi:hypothetical protein E6P14_01090 (plasmid) [Haloarcula marismortui ATCC 43049]|uniref:C2H2-type domain-containing protein n=1 Tax=Haloarcula marismortui (strain ATCC 43049 / DSM 3752 / JCM 8966 / VKM B-1809) TaxID=272569 RepID=A0A4P8JU44_HALMA|nr:hypothetical protein E6P14_01090 [Haloarcula marismortui ATCC 43049]